MVCQFGSGGIGEMYTGGGHSWLQETYAPVGVPVMMKRSFIRTEKVVGDRWKEKIQETMVEAGKEDKRMAEERGDYHEGGSRNQQEYDIHFKAL